MEQEKTIKTNETNKVETFKTANERKSEYIHRFKNRPPVIKTGFKEFDKEFRPFGFTMIGGTSGTGKTSFVMNVILNRLKYSRPTIIYSLEMPPETILRRLFMAYKKNNDIDDRFEEIYNEDTMSKCLNFLTIIDATDVRDKGFRIDDKSELVQTVRRNKSEFQTKDVLVVIDSLHCLPADDNDARLRIEDNITKIRTFVDGQQVSALVIGQSSRENGASCLDDIRKVGSGKVNYDKVLQAFKGTGAIEYMSDVVIYLVNKTDEDDDCKIALLAKHRERKSKKMIEFQFRGENYSFTETKMYDIDAELKKAEEIGKQAESGKPEKTSKGKNRNSNFRH